MQRTTLLAKLKHILTDASFLINTEPRKSHMLIGEALILLSDLERIEQDPTTEIATAQTSIASVDTSQLNTNNLSILESKEIEKIKKRLPKWAKNPSQINARILNAYLELKRSGQNQITEQLLSDAVPTIDSKQFFGNFTQMNTIARGNHGKVFDVQDGYIRIWEPVELYVRDFEKQVFAKMHGAA